MAADRGAGTGGPDGGGTRPVDRTRRIGHRPRSHRQRADRRAGAPAAPPADRTPGPGLFPALSRLPLVLEQRGWWLLAGVGFLALAEVIRRGLAMRAELDEVI